MSQRTNSILGDLPIEGPTRSTAHGGALRAEFIDTCVDAMAQWTKTLSSGTIAQTAATVGGAVTITPNNADNAVVNAVGPEMFQLQSGKPLTMEFKFATNDVDDSGFFVGLCDSDTTILDDGGVAQNDHLGVVCSDGSTVNSPDATATTVNFRADDSGSAQLLDTGVTLADLALHTYRMEYDGDATSPTVTCYVDGSRVGTLTTSIENAVVMAPAIEVANRIGDTSTAPYMILHYFMCSQDL